MARATILEAIGCRERYEHVAGGVRAVFPELFVLALLDEAPSLCVNPSATTASFAIRVGVACTMDEYVKRYADADFPLNPAWKVAIGGTFCCKAFNCSAVQDLRAEEA